MKNLQNLHISIQNTSDHCDVFVGSDLFSELIIYLKKKNICSRYVIITDSNLKKIYADKLLLLMKKAGLNAEIIAFKAGEKSKNRKVKAKIEDEMLKKKYGRDTAIIALGGGVVGDLAGFIAGTYMRGIPYIQYPTTIIAQSDSSYGGKTGIDVPAGKNLIGVFHNPIAIFVDSNPLSTLDKRNYISGFVEVLKHSFIQDKQFYDYLKKNIKTILDRKGKAYHTVMRSIMLKNIQIKRSVVIKDSKEKGLRKILNYGHTVGHAVESLSRFKLLHGEAVGIGIAVEAFIAYKLGYSTYQSFLQQKELLENFGVHTRIPAKISTQSIIDMMIVDKKAREGIPEFSLIEKIGKYKTFKGGSITIKIPERKLRSAIDKFKKLKD